MCLRLLAARQANCISIYKQAVPIYCIAYLEVFEIIELRSRVLFMICMDDYV